MTDCDKSGRFKTPRPSYVAVLEDSPSAYLIQFDPCQHIPWVTSTASAQALAQVLNVLGRIGRTDNISVAHQDEDYDKWDVPTIIIGGGWKCSRALDNCRPYFKWTHEGFTLLTENESFRPKTTDEDIGLLQKMINPTNGQPIWLIFGIRGAGTVAASYALVRWWRHLGRLYGRKPFGLLVSCNDKDGWQQSHIITLYPKPHWLTRLRHPYSWYSLKKRTRSQVNSISSGGQARPKDTKPKHSVNESP